MTPATATRAFCIFAQNLLSSKSLAPLLLLLAICQPLLGQGNVNFILTNRGDVNIVGDNANNWIAIYPDDFFPEDLVIEGIGGTTITLIEPGFPPITDTVFYLDKFSFDIVRSITIDLKEGSNLAEISFLPPAVMGNFRVNLGRGRNLMEVFVSEPTDIFGGIDVRGSRTAADSGILLGGFNDAIWARQASFDLGGNGSIINIFGIQTARNFSATTRGNDSGVVAGELLVSGQTRINLRGSNNCFFDLYFSELFGRTNIQSRGDNGFGILEENLFYSDVNLRMGNSNNELEVCFNEFFSNRRSRFQAGRGANVMYEQGNFFQTPPDVRGFSIEDKIFIPF